MEKKLISVVIPVYNEEKNIPIVYDKLKKILSSIDYDFEIIFVNDGSTDRSQAELGKLSGNDKNVKIVEFTRNFGKEAATSAGISICEGSACLLLDADLQHPVELIPDFLVKWKKGAEVVVGVRNKNRGEGLIKKIGSYLFYLTINKIAETKIVPRATDYRLLDKAVIEEFKRLKEKNRMTRALIDWLGFKQDYVYFNANERKYGNPGYGYLQLVKLALSSYVAHSLFPLKVAGYLGILITISSGVLWLLMLADRFLLKDPWKLHFSGPAMLAVAILFLVGIILMCLGLIALYIGNIHIEVINRPMYVIKKKIGT